MKRICVRLLLVGLSLCVISLSLSGQATAAAKPEPQVLYSFHLGQ
jgi:hypothetical protein